MGTAVINMNDEFNLLGRKAYISGSSIETFPPIADAPTEKEGAVKAAEEKEEEEGSLFGNFAMGALATAALGALTYVAFGAALAAATVATGGAALAIGVCLAATTAAAATVTVAATVTDAQTGKVRTAAEFAAQLAEGAARGAVTGAALYGLWMGIPGGSMLLGADLAGLFASSSPLAAVSFSKLAALAGYILTGMQAVRSGNEIAGLGTGQNWLLEKLFGGDIDAYGDTAALMDALTAYTIIMGGSTRPEKGKVSRDTLVENATKKTNPGEVKGGSGAVDDVFNFTGKTSQHMNNPARSVPVQTLKDAIATGKAFPDPQGTSAIMYYTTMTKNGRTYNLEVLYDKGTNTIMHFKYTSEAIGPLPVIPK